MALSELLSKAFGIDGENHELCLAQYKVVSAQAPLFYLIMISAMFAVAYVSFSTAPAFLTIVMPLYLLTGFLAAYYGYVIPRSITLQAYRKAIVRSLHTSVLVTMVFGISYSYWIISILGFGDQKLHYLVLAITGLATLGAAICLMHLRAAALSMAVFTLGPLTVYLWMTGEPGYVIISAISALVSFVFVFVATRYSQDFSEIIMRRIEVEAKRHEAELLSQSNRALAELDTLTGLANRRAFMSHLNSQVNDVKAQKIQGLAVGILDLDGFKQINDIYGHSAGDHLLQAVGKRLSEMLPPRVFLARLGGDEFGLIASEYNSTEQLTKIGEEICQVMRIPFDMDKFSAHLGGSVGFAKWNEEIENAERFFEMADYALYHAKDNKRGGVTIFNQSHADTIREVSGVSRRLQDASFEDEMSLVYQPIVSSLNGKTIGFEALARWVSPVLGAISPDVFIRSAERAGTINALTAVLLEKALDEFKSWPQDLFLSFNLSMQDIASSEAMLRLISIVQKSGFDPARLTFEVTESSMMRDYERAMDSLNLLKNMGCKIALDDFGTGYSSLAYVRQMPLDKLKLDRRFIADIETDRNARAIVHAMIEMCKHLQVECIVEGVENVGQFETLNAMGCKIIQGYYFSKPLKGADALRYLSEQKSPDEFEQNPMAPYAGGILSGQ